MAKETKKAAEAPKAVEAAPAKKGVVGWQKSLKTLRSLVNDLQAHIEDGVHDKIVVERLQALAKIERSKVEKDETIPARLNRRYAKYMAYGAKSAK